MKSVQLSGVTVSLPMPVLVVVEDVGWWRGEDGSGAGQPYRNGFTRGHCLEDYRALVRLARALGMQVVVGMVLGEWDRTNILQDVPGATWLGKHWDNRGNVGPHLEETAAFLDENRCFLELACHGLCHEFWRDGQMHRSEFHDRDGRMRSEAVVRRHLTAYADLLKINHLPREPRIFLPPALNHGFGQSPSMQQILGDFGYQFVVTRFVRMRCQMPPQTPALAWEHGVRLLERGLSPVVWHQQAASPCWDFGSPVLAVHWSNLLHHDPAANGAVVDGWAEFLVRGTSSLERLLVPDLQTCWDQCVVWSQAALCLDGGRVVVDLRQARAVPGFSGRFFLKSDAAPGIGLFAQGGRIVDLPSTGGCRILEARSDDDILIFAEKDGLWPTPA